MNDITKDAFEMQNRQVDFNVTGADGLTENIFRANVGAHL